MTCDDLSGKGPLFTDRERQHGGLSGKGAVFTDGKRECEGFSGKRAGLVELPYKSMDCLIEDDAEGDTKKAPASPMQVLFSWPQQGMTIIPGRNGQGSRAPDSNRYLAHKTHC